ncbi:unnamed protein product [Effrenium voratum]|nr:unnamed protein product [Effrenium voratum]
MGAADASMKHIARVQIARATEVIYDSNMLRLMSESWAGPSGRRFRDLGPNGDSSLNPVLKAYNQGNGVDGEAAINHVDIGFMLSTRWSQHRWASSSRAFVGQSFTLDTFTPDTQMSSARITLPFMRELQNGTSYMFRALVVNPRDTFTDVTSPDKYWRIESQYADGTMVDLNRVIPSFAILSRLRYFAAATLSQVGLASTTYRIHFRTDQSLPPQQTVHIYPPAGTTFGGLNGACINTDPVLLSLQFPTPLISGVTRLPEWVSCQVVSSTELMLRNEEPILGGRPLIAGPVFEFFIMNATNAESTPLLNLFQIEVWTAPGWVIYPELTLTSVQTANPGYGLPWPQRYTNFTVTLQTVTEVPSGGSIRIIAPQDYYFGPVIETAATRYDPLVSEPSPQGAGQERPPADKAGLVPVGNFREACSLEFEPCVIMNELDELITLGMVLSIAQETARVGNRTICLDLRAKCDEGGRLSDLISCQSQGSTLDLYIAPMVYVPSRRVFRFLIQGYNARNPPMNSTVNAWHFMTRNSDSENTVLDEKPQVPGVSLIGIVSVDSLVPSNTKVSSIENYVTVTLRLTTQCDPRAILRITFPTEYMRGENAAFSGPAIQQASQGCWHGDFLGDFVKRCRQTAFQDKAVGLLAAARERRNRQDTISYNSVAGACNRRSSWRESLHVLHLLPEKGMRPDVFSCGISAVTLSGLAKPLWRRAEYLLQSFSAADLQLGTVAWGTILDATSKAGIWEAALGLLTSMCLGGPVPDTHCLNVVISAAGRSQSWQQAVSLLSPRMSDEVSFNSALAALEGGNASLSWALLSQMRRLKLEPGHVTYGSCTNVLGSSHLWPDALHCLSFASWSGTAPNIITWGACANAMRGIWAKASNLLGAIRRAQLQATAPCAGAALSAAGGCRQWSQGLAQLATFAARGLATMPMLGAAMSALDGEEDAVRWRQVLEMCRAPATDMAPDLFGLGMGASACGKGGAWSRAVEMLQLTKLRRMEPSLTMCNAVLDGLDRSESWTQSLLLLRLVEGDLSVDSLSLRSLLQASEASGAAQQMPGCLARAGDWIRSEMRGLGYGRPKDEGFLLESFESILDHSRAPEDLVLALRRAVCAPATRALHRLTVSVDVRHHKRSLEKQSSLGQHFTYSALGSGAFPWTFASRRAARATFGPGATGRDPAAKNLVAWTSASFEKGTASRNHGRADLEAASSAALVPVFVDHDRAPHCERQALLAHLRVLNARGRLEAIEEGYPANIPLVVILGLSNPEISPTRARNVWTFEAMSLSSGQEELLNVNLNVTGFKIFGEFSGAYVTGTVLSPLAQNVVGIWFNLKSPLKASLETGQTSQMRLWLPPTFQPLPDCGTSLNLFSLSYDVGRELVKNPFPTTIAYMSMPSGSYCYDFYDDVSGQYYVELTIEQEVSYGLDYAFEFALTNPFTTPASADNVWRFETLQNGVILHLRRSVVGFELEQIKEVRVTPSDTTTLLPLHRLEFYIMSDKYIPGGSKIEITAPNGFIFTCAFFSTDEGLANTTTCYVREPNIAEFTMDTSDPKQPNSPFKLFVYVSNPEFTPQMNYWNFRIISPLAKTLDMRDFVSSFDITGRLEVDIQATFPYFGQVNPLRVVFVQSTILNQADVGNELASQRELLAELEKCGRSLVRFVPAEAEEPRVKPPEDGECGEHFELRLPGIDPPCRLQLVQEGHTGDRKRKRLEQGQLLWGSGLVLAFWLAAGSTPRRRVLELGSGLGTAGLACAMLNFHEVVLSDKPGVVFSLQRNLQLNLHLEQVKCVTLDWSQPAGLQALGVFEMIIGADILYSSTSLRPLVALLGALLAVGGRFHCVDPGRANLAAGPSGPSGLEAFVALVAQEFPAWAVTVEPLEESTALAREHFSRQRILVPQQRRRGLGAALGRAVHETLPVAQLIDADAPYQLLTVERVLSGPDGFIFPANCTDGFRLRMSNAVNQPTSNRGYDVGFVFPPEGMTCRGYDNATVSIRFPDGAGLLRNNYTLEVDVANPGYPPNSTTWSFITRVRNLGEKIVDANRTLEGFGLIELLPMRTDEGGAAGTLLAVPLVLALLLSSF